MKCNIHSHFRIMNSTFISDKMGKMPAAILSVSAKLIKRLNLAYCMSLTDSSFGPEGQKRELLDLRKHASARGTQQLFSVKYVFGESNITYNFLLLEDGLNEL